MAQKLKKAQRLNLGKIILLAKDLMNWGLVVGLEGLLKLLE